MNGKRDYYEVLGVSRTASDQELKSAYRKLAMQHHPDRNPDNKSASEEKFKQITEAYSVLADSEKRSAYDRYGFAGVGGSTGAAQWPDFSSTVFSDFGDLFGTFFDFGDPFGRRRGRRTRAERGADLRYELEISFEEAARGLETKIKIPRHEMCAACRGTGARSGQGLTNCPACGGRGQIRHSQGFFVVSRTCPQCQGAGQVNRDPCAECSGDGRVRKEKVLSIKIPAGVDDSTQLRVAGEGQAGLHGGEPGDLYVALHVRPHNFFERRGEDLYLTVPLSIAQAALGTEIRIPTLDGDHKLRIPEGTQPGSVFRLRGKGMPSLNGRSHGDVFVVTEVVIPSRLTREQRHLFEVLSATVRVDNKPVTKGAAEKARDVFG